MCHQSIQNDDGQMKGASMKILSNKNWKTFQTSIKNLNQSSLESCAVAFLSENPAKTIDCYCRKLNSQKNRGFSFHRHAVLNKTKRFSFLPSLCRIAELLNWKYLRKKRRESRQSPTNPFNLLTTLIALIDSDFIAFRTIKICKICEEEIPGNSLASRRLKS